MCSTMCRLWATTCQDVSFLGRGASSLCVCSVLCEPWLTRRCQVPCTVKITVNKSLSISPIPILILPYNYLLLILISCKQSKVPDICDAESSPAFVCDRTFLAKQQIHMVNTTCNVHDNTVGSPQDSFGFFCYRFQLPTAYIIVPT